MKSWENEAIRLLDKSLVHIPQELNELDWKHDISSNSKKLGQHLSAFANYPGGGIIVYDGIDKTGKIKGINNKSVIKIIEKLSNIARDGITPVAQIEHSILEYKNVPILLLHIKESSIKPWPCPNSSLN